jgi:hypothetical protein
MSTQPNKAFYRPMSRREYERAMDHYHMPPAAFTEMIGISWRQGERYRVGHTIPDPVAKLIRTIIKNDLAPQDVG